METTSLVALVRKDNIHFYGDELAAVMAADNHLYAPPDEMRLGEKKNSVEGPSFCTSRAIMFPPAKYRRKHKHRDLY